MLTTVVDRVRGFWEPLAAGLLVLAAAIVVGVSTTLSTAGYFGLGALVAAVACPVGVTLGVGLFGEVVAVTSGLWDHRFGNGQHIAACVLVAAQATVAVYIAVHRTRRTSELRQVRAVAEVAQRALLPEIPGRLHGAGFAARYLSAAREASVGGDLYEVVATQHTIRVIIGDVRGKGLPAVRLATVVLGAFREAASTWLDQEQVAAACARSVSREADPEDFVTALLVDIHPDGRLSLCSAGHHPPLLVGATSTAALTCPFSPPLGLGDRFATTTAGWDVGDRLLLFTDGLIEARDGDRAFFQLERHVDLLRGVSPDVALDQLTSALTGHVGGNLHDDLALLLVERLATGSSTEASPAGASGLASGQPGRPLTDAL
ncbi:serine/threonine protein phosphatase [Parafrankia colletiae]|uniref:Serine/threonine protein phosphatase n=1 Tax=Parafrankia colletiae TaxID=573497 RepID=A0A1S1QRK5_9ACTN|nr:PP2C family protein-serine/threonine phosphatase [Parafrankia colletiae]MCK9902400.1 serine/threonine-protein phosphatase [Frankia sp. Cpl3]OHV35722.1 serine/threonine protein phosphatase [Parafrankia colletiae]